MFANRCFLVANKKFKYNSNLNLKLIMSVQTSAIFNMYQLSLLLVVAIFGSSQAVQWTNGTCPDLETLPRFLPAPHLMLQFLYERKTVNNFIFDDQGKCTFLFNSFSHGVFSSIYQQLNKDNETQTAYGVASVVDDPKFMEKKIFNFRFFGEHLQPIQLPAIILATDLENYAVTYTCKQITDPDTEESKKMESAWVYTAERGDTSHDSKIKSDLEVLGLDYDSFTETDQSNCPEK